MNLRIRLHDDEPIEVSNDDFRQLVRDGVVQGDTPVWGEIFTDGQWWTAADLRMFHECSPTSVPKGSHLVEEEARKRRVKAQEARMETAKKEHADGFLEALGLIDLEGYFGLEALQGAARLWRVPVLKPESVMTILFFDDRLDVLIATGASSYWAAIPRLGLQTLPDGTRTECSLPAFDPGKVVRLHAVIRTPVVPRELRCWSDFCAEGLNAVDCETLERKGLLFRHELLYEGRKHKFIWASPSRKDHTRQWDIIRAYEKLEQVARKLAGKG